MRRREGPEQSLQRMVARYLDFYHFLWFHPPNGGARSRVEAAIFKALGVKPGVPDIIIISPPDVKPGLEKMQMPLAIELKSQEGELSEFQKDWLFDLESAGWGTAVCRSLEEVEDAIKRHGWSISTHTPPP